MSKRNKRRLTPEEKTDLEILVSLIIMGGAFLFLVWCFIQAINVSY